MEEESRLERFVSGLSKVSLGFCGGVICAGAVGAVLWFNQSQSLQAHETTPNVPSVSQNRPRHSAATSLSDSDLFRYQNRSSVDTLVQRSYDTNVPRPLSGDLSEFKEEFSEFIPFAHDEQNMALTGADYSSNIAQVLSERLGLSEEFLKGFLADAYFGMTDSRVQTIQKKIGFVQTDTQLGPMTARRIHDILREENFSPLFVTDGQRIYSLAQINDKKLEVLANNSRLYVGQANPVTAFVNTVGKVADQTLGRFERNLAPRTRIEYYYPPAEEVARLGTE
ncbi:MAG: hypothetical protein QW331_03375 [Candidatus Woesearchaeota archaeon]